MEILTSVRRLYIRFKSLVNDFVYSFGRAALLLLVEVWNRTVPVRERRRIRVIHVIKQLKGKFVPFYVMKAYRGIGVAAPLVLTLGTGQLYTTQVSTEQKNYVISRAILLVK